MSTPTEVEQRLPAAPATNADFDLRLGILHGLIRRAAEGGSYKATVSPTRIAMRLPRLGTFDEAYSAEVAGKAPGHEYLGPETLTAGTRWADVAAYRADPDAADPGLPHRPADPAWLPPPRTEVTR
jgi:hypothetical protein